MIRKLLNELLFSEERRYCFMFEASTTNKHPNYKHFPSTCGFSLEETLHSGYSGKVFRGHHLQTNRPVVVKCCKKLTSWQTETKALNNLDHPNIIKLVGTCEPNVPATDVTQSLANNEIGFFSPQRDGLPPPSFVHVLAQELASNGDFYQLLHQHGSFQEHVARTLVKPIVQGLLYAYTEQGISHRDIKLENIFIMEDGTVKIGDWGLSGFDTRDRVCISSCGTLGYMAPEMVCREKYDANKTDVWAVAVLLFSLCTNIRPYAEPQHRRKNASDCSWRDEWLKAMVSGKWKLWWVSHARASSNIENMSTCLRDLFERMFAGDTKQRATLADVLNHEWMHGPVVSNNEIAGLCRVLSGEPVGFKQ